MSKNYYEILEIPDTSTTDEIKKAYKSLALKLHPDKNKSQEAEDQFKLVTQAYKILSDPKSRRLYNQEILKTVGQDSWAPPGHFHFYPSPESWFSYEQIFAVPPVFPNNFFIFGPNGFQPMQMFDPANVHLSQDPPVYYDLNVCLEDIDSGCVKKMKVTKWICTGQRTRWLENKILTVQIKPGMKDCTEFIFEKESNQQFGRIPADIIVIAREQIHPLFKRDNCDIIYTANVQFKQAFFDMKVQVPTLQGETMIITLNDFDFAQTKMVRITGKGLPMLEDPTQRGDLVVLLDLQYPSSTSGNSNPYEVEWSHNEIRSLLSIGL